VLDRMATHLKARPTIPDRCCESVEHPLGTIKQWMNQGTFLVKGLDNVRAEFSLAAPAYDLPSQQHPGSRRFDGSRPEVKAGVTLAERSRGRALSAATGPFPRQAATAANRASRSILRRLRTYSG